VPFENFDVFADTLLKAAVLNFIFGQIVSASLMFRPCFRTGSRNLFKSKKATRIPSGLPSCFSDRDAGSFTI